MIICHKLLSLFIFNNLELPSSIGQLVGLKKLIISKNKLGYESDFSNRLREISIEIIKCVLNFPVIHEHDTEEKRLAKEVDQDKAIKTAFSEQLYRVALYHMIGKKRLDPFKEFPLDDLGIDDKDDVDVEINACRKILNNCKWEWPQWWLRWFPNNMGVLSRLVQLQPTYVYEFLLDLKPVESIKHMSTRNYVDHSNTKYTHHNSIDDNISVASSDVNWDYIPDDKKPQSGPIPFLFPLDESEFLIRSTENKDAGEHYWFYKAGIKYNKKGHRVRVYFSDILIKFWNDYINPLPSVPPPEQSITTLVTNIIPPPATVPKTTSIRLHKESFSSVEEASLLSEKVVCTLTMNGNDEIRVSNLCEPESKDHENGTNRSLNRIPSFTLQLDGPVGFVTEMISPKSDCSFNRSRGNSDFGMDGAEDQTNPNSDVLSSRQQSHNRLPIMNTQEHIKLDFTMVRRSFFSRAKVPVVSYTLPFKFVGNNQIEFLQIIFKVSEATDRMEIFDKELIQVAILSAWEQYGFYYHCFITLVYVALLASLSYSNYTFHSQDYHTAIVAVMVFTCLFIAFEIKEFSRDPAAYLLNIPNYFQLACYVLTLTGCCIRIVKDSDTDLARSILSVATILLWINALNFLRPFTLTGPLIRMISYVLLRLVPFFIILAIVLFGFSQGLYLLTYDDNEISTFPDFATPTTAYSHAFAYLTGSGTSYDSGGIDPGLRIFLTVIFILFAQACIWNLIIAFLNSCYQAIKDKETAYGMKERCNILIDQFQFISRGFHNRHGWIHYLKRAGDLQSLSGMSSDDVAEEMYEAHHEHIEELQLSLKQVSTDATATTNLLSNKITNTGASFKTDIESSTDALKSTLESDLVMIRDQLNGFASDLADKSRSSLELLKSSTHDKHSSTSVSVEELTRRINDLNAQISTFISTNVSPVHSTPTAVDRNLQNTLPSATNLKGLGYSVKDLQTAGHSVNAILAAGYTIREMRAAGYTVKDLKTARCSVVDMYQAGYSATDMRDAGCTSIEMRAANCPAIEMNIAGYSVKELQADYTAAELKAAGYKLC